jgi:ADP-heptose:LPS heptosyltransferase
LAEKGTQPVLIGREDERPVLDAIGTAQPEAMNLSAQTSLGDLIGLGANAALAIGNDTGPMHPIAMAGCPSLVLFSAASDPALCQPRGRAVSIIAEDKLNNLTAARVIEACGHLAA